MKNSYITNFLKKQIFAICSCLVLVIIGSILVSSALFTTEITSDNTQQVTTGTFNVSFSSGSIINNDIFITSDEEGLNTTGYSFTVENSGTLEATYEILLTRNDATTYSEEQLISNKYIRYSLDDESPRTLSNTELKSGTYEDGVYRIKLNNLAAGSSQTHTLKIWVDNVNTTNDEINKVIDLSIQVQAIVTDVSSDLGYPLVYTGSEQIFTVPYSGTYTITASGAQGAIGNTYNTQSNTTRGGKGATISAEFTLEKGDTLHIIVGGMGTTTNATSNDGTSGAGGGGTFIFKEIDSVSLPYHFTKEQINYETLLVAAGGSGTGDIANGYTISYDANASNFYSPSNYIDYNTSLYDNLYSALSINSYISTNLSGNYFEHNDGTCNGGYGGGNCNDNEPSYGGGWYSSNFITYSFSSGNNTTGIDGNNDGNGYVNIKLKS